MTIAPFLMAIIRLFHAFMGAFAQPTNIPILGKDKSIIERKSMKKTIFILSFLIGAQFSPIKANLSGSAKAAVAAGVASIMGAGIYAWNTWNRLKPLTNEQIVAQGEKLLAQCTEYTAVISSLQRDTAHYNTVSQETLTAAKNLFTKTAYDLSKLNKHSDLITDRLPALNNRTDEDSKQIFAKLKTQQGQLQLLAHELYLILDLDLIAEGERILAQFPEWEVVALLCQDYAIRSVEDVSEKALEALYPYYPTLAKIAKFVYSSNHHANRLTREIDSLASKTDPESDLISMTMKTQREQLQTLLPQLTLLAQIHGLHSNYFSLCDCEPELLSKYGNELHIISSNSSQSKIEKTLIATISRNGNYPLMNYEMRITDAISSFTEKMRCSSKYPILQERCYTLSVNLAEIKSLVVGTQNYSNEQWRNSFETYKKEQEAYRREQETRERNNLAEIAALRVQNADHAAQIAHLNRQNLLATRAVTPVSYPVAPGGG